MLVVQVRSNVSFSFSVYVTYLVQQGFMYTNCKLIQMSYLLFLSQRCKFTIHNRVSFIYNSKSFIHSLLKSFLRQNGGVKACERNFLGGYHQCEQNANRRGEGVRNLDFLRT